MASLRFDRLIDRVRSLRFACSSSATPSNLFPSVLSLAADLPVLRARPPRAATTAAAAAVAAANTDAIAAAAGGGHPSS